MQALPQRRNAGLQIEEQTPSVQAAVAFSATGHCEASQQLAAGMHVPLHALKPGLQEAVQMLPP